VLLCKLDLSTRLLQPDGTYDFAPPAWGTIGGGRTEPLVLSNWEGLQGSSKHM
jgi:hypothetical protein